MRKAIECNREALAIYKKGECGPDGELQVASCKLQVTEQRPLRRSRRGLGAWGG